MKPPLEDRQIRNRATSQSYSRGKSYYQNGAIFNTIKRGHEIEGYCEGSSDELYHVSATLDANGNIEETICTCDYAYGGDCKHIVALLLTYLHKPESFDELASVQDTLEERNKEELITLIRQMVARYPDLKTLIDRPVPRPQSAEKMVDVTPFRRELREAINQFNHWGDHSAQHSVESVAAAARAFADVGQWHNASVIYRLILEECIAQEQYPADDEGDLIWALNSVVDAVIECLEQTEINRDEHERRALIEQLTDVYIWNIELGGYGLGEETLPDALLGQLQPQDIPSIRARVQASLARQQRSEFGQWQSEALAHFQMELDALDNTDPEETLRRLHEQGLHRLEFEKLIAMGRVEGAISVVSKHLTNSYERLLALPHLLNVGHSEVAIRLANESLRAGFDPRLANWLSKQYQASSNHEALFELRLLCMKQQPSVEYYSALKQAAEAVDAWAKVRPAILKELETRKAFHVLAHIYLHEEAWDAAWEIVETAAKQSQKSTVGWGWIGMSNLELEVAEKSQHARPQKAIPVFIQFARQQINHRTRQHYGTAARYLAKVRDLYAELDDEDPWLELIGGIREEFRRLPALQDELKQADL